jgi:hypothetical protein
MTVRVIHGIGFRDRKRREPPHVRAPATSHRMNTVYVVAVMTHLHCGLDVLCFRAVEPDPTGAHAQTYSSLEDLYRCARPARRGGSTRHYTPFQVGSALRTGRPRSPLCQRIAAPQTLLTSVARPGVFAKRHSTTLAFNLRGIFPTRSKVSPLPSARRRTADHRGSRSEGRRDRQSAWLDQAPKGRDCGRRL